MDSFQYISCPFSSQLISLNTQLLPYDGSDHHLAPDQQVIYHQLPLGLKLTRRDQRASVKDYNALHSAASASSRLSISSTNEWLF